MMNILRPYILISLLCLILAGCLGRVEGPDTETKDIDSLIGRFIREIGTEEMDILLRSPDDPLDPGLPVNDLLYMLDIIDPDRLILLVKKTGARRMLDLANAIKRMGCNRPVEGHPLGRFNIPFENSYSDCTKDDFNHLKVMADLIKGTDDVNKLIAIINRVSLDTVPYPDPIYADRQYLEKIAYITVYMDSPEKLLAMTNGTIDSRDTVYLIDMFDNSIAPPVATADIVSGTQLGGITRLLNLISMIDSPDKLYPLINGSRPEPGPAHDAAQISYIRDRMVPIMEGDYNRDGALTPEDNSAGLWALKLAALINTSSDSATLVDLVTILDPYQPVPDDDITRMINLISLSDSPESNAPHDNALRTLAYVTENLADRTKMVEILRGIPPEETARMINFVAAGSQTDDNGGKDLPAAGRKMVCLIDHVPADIMIPLINEAIARPYASVEDIGGFINHLRQRDLPSAAVMITAVNGARDPLLIGLLCPFDGTPDSGAGCARMAEVVSLLHPLHITDHNGRSAPERLADFILGLNTAVPYRGEFISDREAMVRLLAAGVMYGNTDFPGLGPGHLALMINRAEDTDMLSGMMNNVGLEQMAPIIGCGDRVGDPEGDGIGPFLPDFHAPCTAINIGW
jgi:hypothetical protein